MEWEPFRAKGDGSDCIVKKARVADDGGLQKGLWPLMAS